MSTVVVVFAKAPVAGFAKTRLIPRLGAHGAAQLAERMLHHALQQASEAAVGPVELCVAPDAQHPAVQAAAQHWGADLTTQGTGDLGARMHRAFCRVLQRHPQAVVIGTDAPALDAAALRANAEALSRHDATIVPATDGGYALIGLRRADERWFTDMPWSTSAVFAATTRRWQEAGLAWWEHRPVTDIDEPADLVHVPADWKILPSAD